MRIGFVGVGGTGKTTVLTAVNKVLGLPILPSVARSVWADFGITEKDMTDNRDYDFALTIQRAIFDKRLLAEMDYGGFISDRTLLDTYCYMLMWCHQGMTDSVARSLFVVTLENMKKYDAIFYFPLEAFRTTDETSGMRAQGAAQALLMDNLLKGFLLKAFPGYSVVPGAGVEQRTEHILDTIRRYKKWKS